MFRYIKSSHEKFKLVHNNMIYLKDKCSNKKTLYKCEQFAKFKCRARLHIENEVIVKIIGEHNHSGNISKINCNDIMSSIRNKAVSKQDTPSQIIASSTTGISFNTSAELPSVTLLKKTINRKRKQNDVLPNPLNNLDLVIPPNLSKTYLNENFCLYDSGPAEIRTMMFGTEQNLNELERCNHWYVDGTFQSCPSLFYQMFTIHGIYIVVSQVSLF